MDNAIEKGLGIQIRTLLIIASVISFIIVLMGGGLIGYVSAHETAINSNVQKIIYVESGLSKLEDVTKILHGHSIHFKNMINDIKEIKDNLK